MPKNFTHVADRLRIKAPPQRETSLCGGVTQEKKKLRLSHRNWTSCRLNVSLDSRLLWGSHKKKVGGVTGIGPHAVSMSRLYDGHPRAEEEAIKITVPYQSVLAGHEMQVGILKPYEEDRRNSAAL
ncbi:hypothetical protein TNCV_1108961 [Trichonephila clavipes]|nr:hypothetical protein TNCV_1108961 [Trichonephila clavipes]